MHKFFFLFVLLFSTLAHANSFKLIALGVNGGLTDGNLSAYLLRANTSSNYISLDAGTLVLGLEIAKGKHAYEGTLANMLAHHLPFYLISHAHLDHILGLSMAQPDLHQHQTILARQETLTALEQHIFNWSVWANFSDGPVKPALKWQHNEVLPLQTPFKLVNTDLNVKAYPLNHGHNYPSTAFLIQSEDQHAILYFGDTGADSIEHVHNMENIWRDVAPLIRAKKLSAILLECSYTNDRPDAQLFGHLKPSLYLATLTQLAKLVAPEHPDTALNSVKFFITHIKPQLNTLPGNATQRKILQQLKKNKLNLHLILPTQGQTFSL